MTAAKRRRAGTDSGSASDSESTSRKAVLFCPVCGHEAPVDGDWAFECDGDGDGDAARVDVECPECGHVVVSQPRLSGGDNRNSFFAVGPILRFVDSLVRHDVR